MTPDHCNIWRSWSHQWYLAMGRHDDAAAENWKTKRARHVSHCPICQQEPKEPVEHDYAELDGLEEEK